MANKLVDLALGANGKLFLLTDSALLETDPDGKLTKPLFIGGLVGAVAVDINPVNGEFAIAEGGTPAEPLNRIRFFSADGKDTGRKIGMGGDYHGRWSPDKFAFSTGTGDLAFGKDGELYVNPGWSDKLYTLSVLTRFDARGNLQSYVSSIRQNGGIVADDDLSVYVGGQLKINWDNQVEWTSGLIPSGVKGSPFPSSGPYHWPVFPLVANGKIYFFNKPGGTLLELDRKTGERVRCGNVGGSDIGSSKMVLGAGKKLFVLEGNSLKSIDDGLKISVEIFSFKIEKDERIAGIDVDGDGKQVFVVIALGKKARLTCYDLTGSKLVWERACDPSSVVRYHNGMVAMDSVMAQGRQLLDAGSGERLCWVEGKKQGGGERSPLKTGAPAAFAAKEGADYLFCQGEEGFRVYRIHRSTTAGDDRK